jgi:hypothetical protein
MSRVAGLTSHADIVRGKRTRAVIVLIAVLLGLIACRSSDPQPQSAPPAAPATAAPIRNETDGAPAPDRSPATTTPVPTYAPTAALPRPVIDFLRSATPVPALTSPERVTVELLRLFNEPPYSFLTLDPEHDAESFHLTAASIPPGFRIDSMADNATHTLRAVAGFDASTDQESWQLYVVTLLDGKARRVRWDTYAGDRPIQQLRWLGEDILVFSQWLSPRGGRSWAFDFTTQEIAQAGTLASPDLPPRTDAHRATTPALEDPRTPVPPRLADSGPFAAPATPDNPRWAQLTKEGDRVFHVQDFTFALDKEYLLPPYVVRLWQSDSYWEQQHVTISARGQPTIQVDSVRYLVVHNRPGILGEDVPSVEIVAGVPTGEGGLSTLLYSLGETPRLVLETAFGRPGSFEDLDGDGVSEFVLTEPPCARAFCDNPATVQSSSIYRYTGDEGWTKANERFAALLSEERSRNEQLAARATPGPPLEFTDRPRCAVYVHVADLLYLGRVTEARQALERYYKYPDVEEFWVEINQSVQNCGWVRPLSNQ